MTALRRLLDTITGGLSALLLASMIVMVTWQVISRYLLNDPSTFTEETLRFGVIWLSLIGAAYVTGRGKHMSVDLIKDMLSPAAQRIINIVIQLGFMAFAGAVLIFGGLRAVNIAWYQTSAVLQVPMGAVYAASADHRRPHRPLQPPQHRRSPRWPQRSRLGRREDGASDQLTPWPHNPASSCSRSS